METISSRHNPLVKTFRALGRERPATRILLEGLHLVREAVGVGLHIEAAALASRLLSAGHADLLQLAGTLESAGARVVSVPAHVLAAMSPARTPSGVVAIAECRPLPLDAVFARAPQFVLILVDLQDPGNVGAVIRAADAAGATGVVPCGRTADPFDWKALRGAMGSTFRVPVAERQTAAHAVAAARAHRTRILATSPRDGTPLYQSDLAGPIAIMLGNEGSGLPRQLEELADERLSIPMRVAVESLNVAIAAALISYEGYRQRTLARDRALSRRRPGRRSRAERSPRAGAGG